MAMLNAMMVGGILVCAWAISLFFFRYWRKTGDRLFGFFAAAFLLLGIERLCIVAVPVEAQCYVYLIRFCAFLLILWGILDKNRHILKD